MLTNFNEANVYSHSTSTFIVCEVLPQSSVASHLYSPVWFLVMFISVKTFFITGWPSGVIQDTTSEGPPEARHIKVKLSSSVIVWLCISCMDGGTKDQETVMTLIYTAHPEQTKCALFR